MPKSKRAKLVSLTKASKKDRDHKASVIREMRDAIDRHADLYLFSYENMRSQKFKDIRMHFRERGRTKKEDGTSSSSRIFLGKTRLMRVAMGRSSEDEYGVNLRKVSDLAMGRSSEDEYGVNLRKVS